MMSNEFGCLLTLPGAPDEQSYIQERLETLSVRENYVLAAAITQHPPVDMRDAVNHLRSLDDFEICFPAGSYAALGELSLRRDKKLPEDVLPHVDLDRAGKQYEDAHPGLFVGSCYVCYPTHPSTPALQENKLPLLWDSDWSVKLKLASPTVPEGVWLRLPGHDGKLIEDSDEVVLALHELKAETLENCTLLEAQCILPEAGNLMKQYYSITELVRDGDNLGCAMDEQGQGNPHWLEKFAAALEYENCRTLKFALDISQNLHCYEWISSEELAEFAAEHLRNEGVSEDTILSGCINLEEYAKDLLETSGYMEASGEIGYLLRNTQEFLYEFSAPGDNNFPQQDILTAFPFLEKLSHHASPEEAEAARRSIAESLSGRGQEGLRQLQAAMEYEDCASLGEAVEIAARLDSYEFIGIDSFQEDAKRDLLEKGLDERVIGMCFNLESYAAITHDFEDIYSSHDTGLYVHRNNAMSQPEQGGMTMQ